jgi:hypothetical protein
VQKLSPNTERWQLDFRGGTGVDRRNCKRHVTLTQKQQIVSLAV